MLPPSSSVSASGRAELPGDLPALAAWIACLALLAGWGAYLASTLGTVQYADRADEGWYLQYATEVSTRGLGVLPELFARYLGDPAAQIYPNPLRVLYIAASAAWCELFGASFAALSSLSIACHLLAALATFAAARPAFGHARALVLAALLATSPLLSGLARRALMDSFAILTLVLAVWAYLAWARELASRRRAAAFALAFLAALTAKENHVLFAPVFAAHLAWIALARGRRVPWRLAVVALTAPALVAGAAFAFAAGGIDPLVAVARVILESPATNEYALRYGGGPWYRYLIDFLALSPWVTAAALLALGALACGRLERGRDSLEFFAILAVGTLAIFALFTKNVRYVAGLELAWRALATALAFELAARFGARTATIVGLALGAAACAVDAVAFRALFVVGALYDPVSASLLGLRDIVPFRLRR